MGENQDLRERMVAERDGDLLNFLKSLEAKKEVKKENIMSMMVLGEGESGKTTLLQTLSGTKGKKFNVQTDGIEIKSFYLKGKSNHPKASKARDVRIAAYDFAGQKDYFVTHHLFLSARAIYLIVFKITNVDYSTIDYWINSIRSIALRSDEMPPQILLVGTHLDQMGDDILADRVVEGLREMYREPPYRVSGVVTVTATRPGGSSRMDELNYYLIEMCLRSPHIPRIVPHSYFSLSTRLRSLAAKGVHWIDKKDFVEMMEEVEGEMKNKGKEGKERLVRDALEVMSDGGTLLYIGTQGVEKVVLKLDWLFTVLTNIISPKHQFCREDGTLSTHDLPHLWKGTVDREDYPPLLQLLSHFGIAYVIPHDVPFMANNYNWMEGEQFFKDVGGDEEEGERDREGERDTQSYLSYSCLERSGEMRLFIPSRLTKGRDDALLRRLWDMDAALGERLETEHDFSDDEEFERDNEGEEKEEQDGAVHYFGEEEEKGEGEGEKEEKGE
eukprot:CAMPEP_0201517496 /NCGR_PEP_ID=MMETSP0161_2-20130828/8583_1 /ASSEMBLY_ACC=CAM_ASM_000251 /TAXON_ID=180227 /ORGANISM="Neoparamoeba aestuarina, Strain SoJaBio B1-5/56/2" /LENGTH=499 /DNA_ID=CAMNT_0047915009 /DNA_START=202 /DNA_END=1698 /DNA_ORIENTATION=+